MANIAITVPRLVRLPENSAFTHGVKIKASDVNDSANSTDGDVATIEFTGSDLPSKFVVARCVADVSTAFATDGTLTYSVGTDGDDDNFLTDTDAKTAGVAIAAIGGAPVTLAGSFGSSGDDLMVSLNTQAATGALSDITAGELDVYFDIIDIGSASLNLN
jgi:hypothetical protein